jgi:methylenetetrahydrofolate dehydrogenase (NADP+)/methenyltetrahydrofolate cyclohydrolase
MHNIIDGKKIAAELREELRQEVGEIYQKYQKNPTLAVILVGDNSASKIYVKNKAKAAKSVGINSIQINLAENISEITLIQKIEELNNDTSVHGILVQLPLPSHIDSNKAISAVDYKKDVDGFNIINVGKLSIGDKNDFANIIPCTPAGCLYLLKKTLGENLQGLKALVIGSSNIVGRPMARLLMLEKCTVTIANSKTKDLKSQTLQADIIVSATGISNLITADMVNENTTIIDVGINRIQTSDGKSMIVGDVDFTKVQSKVKFITPVPGGVGPMTIAYLLKNTIKAFKNILKNT